jgi:hypothetical protein
LTFSVAFLSDLAMVEGDKMSVPEVENILKNLSHVSRSRFWSH